MPVPFPGTETTGEISRLNTIRTKKDKDPNDIVERTLAFVEETGPSSVLLSYLSPTIGSEFYKYAKRFGMNINTFDWSRYTTTAGRFEEEEVPDIIFDYDPVIPFGKSMSRERIYRNHIELQGIFRERGLIF